MCGWMVEERGGCDSLQMEITSTAQGYWLPSHPLGRAAGPDAVAKFEIC